MTIAVRIMLAILMPMLSAAQNANSDSPMITALDPHYDFVLVGTDLLQKPRPKEIHVTFVATNLDTGQPIQAFFNISASRYRIGGLKPNSWYGLEFKTSLKYSSQETTNTEFQLFRTRNDETMIARREIAQASMTYSGKTAVVKWDSEAGRNFDVLTVNNLVCGHVNVSKQSKLTVAVPNTDIVFTLDGAEANAELQVGANDEKFLRVQVKYRNCSKVCWSYWVFTRTVSQRFSSLETCQMFLGYDTKLGLQTLDEIIPRADSLLIIVKGPREDKLLINLIQVDLYELNEQEMLLQYEFNATTRGYLLDSLQPNTWYAITFRNVFRHPADYGYEEQRVVKTLDGPSVLGANSTQSSADSTGSGLRRASSAHSAALMERDSAEPGDTTAPILRSQFDVIQISGKQQKNEVEIEAKSLTADYFDLALRVVSSCGPNASEIVLTKHNPTWKTHLKTLHINDTVVMELVEPPPSGDNESLMIQDHNEAMNMRNIKRCDELCWKYQILLRKASESFDVGEECFPVKELVALVQRDSVEKVMTHFAVTFMSLLILYGLAFELI